MRKKIFNYFVKQYLIPIFAVSILIIFYLIETFKYLFKKILKAMGNLKKKIFKRKKIIFPLKMILFSKNFCFIFYLMNRVILLRCSILLKISNFMHVTKELLIQCLRQSLENARYKRSVTYKKAVIFLMITLWNKFHILFKY